MPRESDLDTPWNGMVAGIGASAGGLSALLAFFKALPERTELAFVVILHSLPDRKSHLARLLRACTRLPVCEAADGVTPNSNHIYVARPDHVLTVSRGTFRTQPLARSVGRPGNDTVDSFLESLAADRGERAVAVVFSGTGSDGALGVTRVKQRGGVVFVQDPVTAEHDGMPLAAIRTGAVDHVLPVERIAQEIRRYASADYVPPLPNKHQAETASAIETIFSLVKEKAGFDLSGYKVTPLLWRIQNRVQRHRLEGFAEYATLLQQSSAEIESLVRDIPLHVTQFFRDPRAWDLLEAEVIDRLFEARDPADPVRAWSAACASGEEAYSLAMLLFERANHSHDTVDFKVFATDASPQIVAHASRGVFHARAMSELTAERRARFFHARGNTQHVSRALREKIVFAPQHLITDPPFRGLDLVVCRNLLIYLDTETIRRVVFLLHSALRTGGYLFLGAAESLPADYSGFETVSSNCRIFRKVGPIMKAEVSFPTGLNRLRAVQAHANLRAAITCEDTDSERSSSEALRISHEELNASREELKAVNEELRAANGQLNLRNEELNEANARLLGKIDELRTQTSVLSSAGIMAVFLDDELRVRWFTPGVKALFPLLPADMGRRITDLSAKFHDAGFIDNVLQVMRTEAVSESEVQSADGPWYACRILPFRGGDARKGVAVTFSDITELKNAEGALRETQTHLSADLVGMRRLDELRSKLANETDLNAALDEILAAAVEFSGTDRGIIGLIGPDGQRMDTVVCRGFGDDTTLVGGFRDVGCKSLWDVVRRMRQRLVIEDVASLENSSAPRDRTIALTDGVRAALATPMITHGGEIVGILTTLFREPHRPSEHELRLTDLLAWTAAQFIERYYVEIALESNRHRMRRVLETDAVGVLFFNRQGTLVDANDIFLEKTGWSRDDIDSGALDWRCMTAPEHVRSSEAQMELLEHTGRIGPYEKEYLKKDGSRSWMLFAGRDLGDGTIVKYAIDVNDRKRAEQAVTENEQRFRSFVMASADIVYRMNADWSQMWQLRGAGVIPDLPEPSANWLDVYIHPEDRARVIEAARAAVESRGIFDAEYRVRRIDGRFSRTHSRAVPILNERGVVTEWLGTVSDIEPIAEGTAPPSR